jgi:hypothetical protein
MAPGAEILEPRLSGWDTGRWLAEAPALIAGCDALVAFGLPDGTIGRGVAMELEWAEGSGIPAWEITGRGTLRPAPVAVRLPGEDWQRWARLEGAA